MLTIQSPERCIPALTLSNGITRMLYCTFSSCCSLLVSRKLTFSLPACNVHCQVLYDAFFKHQRKPKLTNLGELYYEGKEYEAKLEHLRPGVLSSDLREALGMTDSSPPPWLVNMQVRGAVATADAGI